MLLKTTALATFLILSGVLSGCAGISIYVLDQEELMRGKAGQVVTLKFDSWILSDRAVKRVMDAKIKDANLK